MEESAIFDDYMELMILFGYTTLFAACLPLAPALAYVAVWIEGKIDAYKYSRLVKRPFPDHAESIGIF